MAARRVRGADGRLWTIRERWMPPLRGLPGDADIDAIEDSVAFMTPVALVVAFLTFPVRLLVGLFAQLLRLSFLPPLIEAVHEGPPYSKMTWRAANRHIGPQVIDEIAAALERGDRRIRVDGATFLGFSTKRDH